jgi:hypothetical protein
MNQGMRAPVSDPRFALRDIAKPSIRNDDVVRATTDAARGQQWPGETVVYPHRS